MCVIQEIVIPPPNINQCSTYLIEAALHPSIFSFKPFIPEVRKSLIPNTLEHKDDNPTPLSLLSIPGDIMKVLQSIIVIGELDIDKLDPNQVNMLETWVPIDNKEQIRCANLAIVEDQVID